MKKLRILAPIVALTLLFGWAIAQENFDWMPKGGRQLLFEVLDQCPTCDDLTTLVTTERTPEEWQAYFADQEALNDLTDQQVDTLATYLAINFPIPELPQQISMEVLPVDGRQLTLEACQNCHAPVAVLEERDMTGWKNLFGNHDHRIIPLTEQQWETLGSYFAINMPVPEEEIPEELLDLLVAPPSY